MEIIIRLRTPVSGFVFFICPPVWDFSRFFLTNVAQLYLKLHRKNTARIEQNMRRRIAADSRAVSSSSGVVDASSSSSHYSHQNHTDGGEGSSNVNVAANATSNHHHQEAHHAHHSQFAALPTGDIEMQNITSTAKTGNGSTLRAGQTYREQIQLLSISSDVSSADGSMRAVLDAVFFKENKKHFEATNQNQNQDAATNTSSISRTATNGGGSRSQQHHRENNFTLRIQVQERIARIIAVEVAGYHSRSEIQDSTASIDMPMLSETMDKWIIPRSARSAFRAVAFETILYVGERGLIVQGADAIFDLSPREFQALFAPFLAAMTMTNNEHEDVMRRWLLGTNLMADVELKGTCSTIGGDVGDHENVLFMSGIMA